MGATISCSAGEALISMVALVVAGFVTTSIAMGRYCEPPPAEVPLEIAPTVTYDVFETSLVANLDGLFRFRDQVELVNKLCEDIYEQVTGEPLEECDMFLTVNEESQTRSNRNSGVAGRGSRCLNCRRRRRLNYGSEYHRKLQQDAQNQLFNKLMNEQIQLLRQERTLTAISGINLGDEIETSLPEDMCFTSKEQLKTATFVYAADPLSTGIAELGPMSTWCVSKITDFSRLFFGREDFNEDLSAWDVSNAVNMRSMFEGASAFSADLSAWNVSRVENTARMFHSASLFTSDLSRWDVSRCKEMQGMFHKVFQFESDLSLWNVGSATDIRFLFSYARSFESDLSRWNVSNALSTKGMFRFAEKFTSDLSMWDVAKVQDMDSMFLNASSFNSNVASWNISATKTTSYMFENATQFQQDLCEWGPKYGVLLEDAFDMFSGTDCPNSTDPLNLPSCTDYEGWTDPLGDDCKWYATFDMCSELGHLVKGTDDLTPNEACCACGRGGGCVDDPSWVNGEGLGCEAYGPEDCISDGDLFSGGGFSPLEACCICGGGYDHVPLPVTPLCFNCPDA